LRHLGLSCPSSTIPKGEFRGSTADQVKGATNEAIGKAKQGVGEAIGSDRLQGEGVIQEIKGRGQNAVGDAERAAKVAVNKTTAAATKNLSSHLIVRLEKDRLIGPVFLNPLVLMVRPGLVPGIDLVLPNQMNL